MFSLLLRRYLSHATARPLPGDGGPSPQGCAAGAFLRACRDTRTAWYSTMLLARCNPAMVLAARSTLAGVDEALIVGLLAEMTGPSATPDPRNAFGSAAHRHVEAAAIVVRLVVKAELVRRAPGQLLDMERVKQALACWIDTADLEPGAPAQVSGALRSISALLHTGAPNDPAAGAQARLVLLAPFAAAVETLLVISRLSPDLLEVMSRTRNEMGKGKGEVSARELRACPEFGVTASGQLRPGEA